jgi:hypothetical protein
MSDATRRVIGVDFTSAPSRRKPIVVARATLSGARLIVDRIDSLFCFDAFDSLLAEPGPWTGAFDLPFGLPRELVATLGWPQQWRALISHVNAIGKGEFKSALNRVRQSRPMGSRYIARRGDAAAGSSSPMKLVNPPVGLMFFEGAPRLAWSGVSIMPCSPSDDSRVALEGYPGYLARQITGRSYKKDGPEGRSDARRINRELIVNALSTAPDATGGLTIQIDASHRALCVDDGSGDALDAVLCAAQAAMALRSWQTGDHRYGMPQQADPLEGWIATVPGS